MRKRPSRNKSHFFEEVGAPAVIDLSDVVELIGDVEPVLDILHQTLRNHPGSKSIVTAQAYLGCAALNELAQRRSTIKNIVATSQSLPRTVQRAWGLTGSETYRQFHRFFTRLVRKLDDPEVAAELEALLGSDPMPEGHLVSGVDFMFTKMFQYQAAASKFDFGRALAFDGTVVRTAAATRFRNRSALENKSRPKSEHDKLKAYSKDPDALAGHYPAKDGQKSRTEVGFESHLASPPSLDGRPIPNIVLAMTFQPNSVTNRVAIRDLLIKMKDDLDLVINDAGYYRLGEASMVKFLDVGIDQVFDPQDSQRQGGSVNGALILDGDAYCPCLPERIIDLPKKRAVRRDEQGAIVQTEQEAAVELMEDYDERDLYRAERHGSTNGVLRAKCPARAGKVRCPLVPESMGIDFDRPTIIPPKNKGKFCTQGTVSLPGQKIRAARQARFAYGTTAWHKIYGQRARVESANADIRHNRTVLAERKWTCVRGQTKTAVMFGTKVLASNILVLRAFKREHEIE